MGALNGITVRLYNRVQVGLDEFNNPQVWYTSDDIDNVLVGQPSTSEIVESNDFYGKRLDLMLGIPKGDTHVWTNALVGINGQYYETFGLPMTGIQDLIPLAWGQNVRASKFGGNPEDWIRAVGTEDNNLLSTETAEVLIDG